MKDIVTDGLDLRKEVAGALSKNGANSVDRGDVPR